MDHMDGEKRYQLNQLDQQYNIVEKTNSYLETTFTPVHVLQSMRYNYVSKITLERRT